jgi:hypothetical protein
MSRLTPLSRLIFHKFSAFMYDMTILAALGSSSSVVFFRAALVRSGARWIVSFVARPSARSSAQPLP